MNINRNNFEIFFLLYTDNELSVEERVAVNEFVQSNPDLQEELVMLQQSVLKPEDISFGDKKSLFKGESVNAGMQEKLLLHLDNELMGGERNEIERLIESKDEVRAEWHLLQQTKLLADTAIVFEDKKSLYRKEIGRVVAFPWRRVAVAAAIIGFAVWSGLAYLNNQVTAKYTVSVRNAEDDIKKDTLKMDYPQINEPLNPAPIKQKDLAVQGVVNEKASKATNLPPVVKTSRSLKDRKDQTIVFEKNNNLPKPSLENVNNAGSNKTILAYVPNGKQANTSIKPGKNDIGNDTDRQDPANAYASTISYNDNNEENVDRVFFMDEEKIKKTKLGGIFRKVKRVIGRSANIKTGNNFKVANLEFSIQ